VARPVDELRTLLTREQELLRDAVRKGDVEMVNFIQVRVESLQEQINIASGATIRERIADLRTRLEGDLVKDGPPAFNLADRSRMADYLAEFEDSDVMSLLARFPDLGSSALQASNRVRGLSSTQLAKIRDGVVEVVRNQNRRGYRIGILEALGKSDQRASFASIQKLTARTDAEVLVNKQLLRVGNNATSGAARDTVEPAMDFYHRNLNPKTLGRIRRERINFEQDKTGRAQYRSATQTVMTTSQQRVTVHEIGHHMEFELPGWQEGAVAFRNARGAARGDGLTRIYPDSPDPKVASEVGFRDEFIDHYMGKSYGLSSRVTATEIVSMGMELLSDTPFKLLKEDPEYFWFMVGLLRGDLP